MISDTLMHRVCPLCGSDNKSDSASRYSKDPWVIKACGDCAFHYLENAPDYERLEVEFAWEKTSQKVTETRSVAAPVRTVASTQAKKIRREWFKRQKIMDLTFENLPETETLTIVDIGCATGHALRKITKALKESDRKVIPIGIEISQELAENAHKKLKKFKGRCIHADALSGLESLEPDSVHGIIMSSYLEHEVRPSEVLAASQKCLATGGIIVVKVPNFSCINRKVIGQGWCGFRYPDHVNYFDPASLAKLAKSVGLKIKRSRLQDRHPLSDNMYVVLEK